MLNPGATKREQSKAGKNVTSSSCQIQGNNNGERLQMIAQGGGKMI